MCVGVSLVPSSFPVRGILLCFVVMVLVSISQQIPDVWYAYISAGQNIYAALSI